MTTRTVERIEDWESRPFDGGYAGLQDLADASFSGVVRVGQATACLLNGTVVGVLDGSIEDFEDESGTIRTAPYEALPLLIVMQERADEVRAKYYSEETPLSSADKKLSDGGFTGYVELSENVLSGDYFVVYHGGKSMSAAYVGTSDDLLTDDEAFQRADDEVGIYKVYPVEIEPIDIPEPETPEESEPAAAGVAADDEPDSESEPEAPSEGPATGDDPEESAAEEPPPEPERDEAVSGSGTGATDRGREREPREDSGTADASGEEVTGGLARRDESEGDDRGGASSRDTDRSRGRDSRDRASEQRGREGDREEGTRDRRDREDRGRGERRPSTERPQGAADTRDRGSAQPQSAGREGTAAPDRAEPERRASGGTETVSSDAPAGGTGGADPLADASESGESSSGDLERRSIPSVDPDKTWTGDEDGPSGGLDAPAGMDADAGSQFEGLKGDSASGDPVPSSEPRAKGQPSSQPSGTPQGQQTGQPQSQSAGRQQGQPSGRPQGQRGGQDTAEITAELREKEQTIEDLEAELADLEAERDDLIAEAEDLEAELRRVREERDELEAEVERLRSTVADLEAAAGDSATVDAEVQLTPAEAIEETNLFVRYGSKGEATLEAAHDGKADKEDVATNLDLEYHTSFDAAQAAVGDQPFEEFLTNTIQYRFVEWVVHDLLYEIRDTGHADALRDLFDALPELDRAELNGVVSVTYTEDGQEQRTQEAFDVVLRDRMGNPIAVANINDSREAATDDMMTSLVTESTRAGESHDTLAGAFFVTASFFDPGALETADEATGGGLLSRDKRESYVRLGRKQGYHLCLVEARDSKYHLAVPEL